MTGRTYAFDENRCITRRKRYADANKRGEPAKSEMNFINTSILQVSAERISIHTPNAKIPDNVVLLDTPGFNTEIESHRQRTWEVIEEIGIFVYS